MATVDAVARHLFLDARNVHRLIEKGVIARQPAGAYDLNVAREAYIVHIRERAAGREKVTRDGDLNGEQERARKDKELADRTALQNAVTRGELVSIEAVGQLVERDFTVVRERLLSIPGKLGADLSRPQAVRVEDEIRDALQELHEPASLAGLGGPPDDDTLDGEPDGTPDEGEAGA